MNYKILPLVMLSWVSAHPSVDRFITELPSYWDHEIVANHPYVPVHPSSDIYKINDPSANYIYSAELWNKMIHASIRCPNSAYSNFYTSAPSFTMAAQMAPVIPQVMHTPVIHRPQGCPSSYENYYVGGVYTTPYEFSGTAGTFVRPNVLYSPYSTYSKPVYVVNNPYNWYSIPSYVHIYENLKPYVFGTHQQPVHGGDDTTKIKINTDTEKEEVEVNIPTESTTKIQINTDTEEDEIEVNILTESTTKKPIRTNLTEIVIDPIYESRNAFGGRTRTFEVNNVNSNILHKRRPSHYNTYEVIHHKAQLPDQN